MKISSWKMKKKHSCFFPIPPCRVHSWQTEVCGTEPVAQEAAGVTWILLLKESSSRMQEKSKQMPKIQA